MLASKKIWISQAASDKLTVSNLFSLQNCNQYSSNTPLHLFLYRTLLPIKLTLSPRLKSVAVNRERNTTGFGYRQIPRLGFEPIYNKTDDWILFLSEISLTHHLSLLGYFLNFHSKNVKRNEKEWGGGRGNSKATEVRKDFNAALGLMIKIAVNAASRRL